MAIAKTHPSAVFGWLYLPEGEAQRALDEKLRQALAEQQKDRHASGEPAAFRAWSIEHVRSLACHPVVAPQLSQRAETLQQEQQRLDREAERHAARHQSESERIRAELALLEQLSLAAAS